MQQMYSKYKDHGLAIMSVDMQEDPDQVKSYAESDGYDWKFVADGDGAVILVLHFWHTGIPSHVFIDRSGVIQAIHVGDLQGPIMEELLSNILHKTASQTTH